MAELFKPIYIDGRKLWKKFDQSEFFVNREDRHIAQKSVEDMMRCDKVEIVRCKDCKYWRDWEMAVANHGFGPNMGECHCAQWENEDFYYLTKGMDFCSYGEKEE